MKVGEYEGQTRNSSKKSQESKQIPHSVPYYRYEKKSTAPGRSEYHVAAKINRGEHIFSLRENRALFMVIFKRAKKNPFQGLWSGLWGSLAPQKRAYR
jgi:hypothetical protein